jgi:N-acetylmuramoyl-L-alanine amidase
VVLDAGHGGENKGALSDTGRYEKDIVLEVALRIQRILRERTDVKVQLTRDSDRDISYSRRIGMANEEGADLFISLHCNAAGNPLAEGVEVFVLSSAALAEESQRLRGRLVAPRGRLANASDKASAAIVKDLFQVSAQGQAMTFAQVVKRWIVTSAGTVDRGVREGRSLVLRGAEMPAVLVELGFVTHSEEARRLDDPKHQEKLAGAIVDAIIEFDAALPVSPGQSPIASH